MDAYTFAAGLQVTSPPQLAHPAEAKAKSNPVELELDDFVGAHAHPYARPCSISITPGGPQTPAAARTQPMTPKTPNGLESNSPPEGTNPAGVAQILPSFFYPAMNKWRVLSACLTYFGNGMNDSGKSGSASCRSQH